MSEFTCKAPIGLSDLVEYWLSEIEETAEARMDEHLLGCGECSERLHELVAIGDGIRIAFDLGLTRAFVTDAFVRWVARRGINVREYRVPRGGSVHCTVTPDDDLLIARLEAPLAGVARVDAFDYGPSGTLGVYRNIPFDSARGEIVLAPKTARIRAMPAHQHRLRLVAVDAGGERVIGDYTFVHTPFVPPT